MPTPLFSVRIRTDRLDALRRVLPDRARQAVDETAESIQRRAAQNAPKRTRSLAESVYLTNGEASDYAQRVATARSLNRHVVILEEIRPEFVLSLGGGDSSSAYSVVVGVAAEHGEPVEFGTRFMAAQPFMTPAVEPERDELVERMKSIANDV